MLLYYFDMICLYPQIILLGNSIYIICIVHIVLYYVLSLIFCVFTWFYKPEADKEGIRLLTVSGKNHMTAVGVVLNTIESALIKYLKELL